MEMFHGAVLELEMEVEVEVEVDVDESGWKGG